MEVRADVEALAWVSEFFGRGCARLAFSVHVAPLTTASFAGFDLVEALVPAPEPYFVDGLADLGFRFAEGQVDLDWHVGGRRAGVESRPAAEADLPGLRGIADASLCVSRYRLPWYSTDERRRLYRQWVDNAVRGTFDHVCLLPAESGEPQGFVTLRALGDGTARVGLMAVAPGSRRQGIGGRLLDAAESWCTRRGVTRLCVTTQAGNLDAIRFYQSRGARIIGLGHWMYR